MILNLKNIIKSWVEKIMIVLLNPKINKNGYFLNTGWATVTRI